MILKNTGVLFHNFYLVASALGLAPCAVGMGDADRFCKLAGVDYYEESTVGEFILS
ncbi:MAG: nitroreductase family protein [Bacteroidota bacterium]